MITTKNYFDKVKTIDLSKLPAELQKSHAFIEKATKNGTNWTLYEKNEAIKKTIDLHFDLVSKLSEIKSPEKEKPAPKKPLVMKDVEGDGEGKRLKESDIPAIVRRLMPPLQQKAIIGSREHFGIVKKLEEQLEELPKIYEQEQAYGKFLEKNRKWKGNSKDFSTVHAHYYLGGSDWYILEWDGQSEFFGYAVMGDMEDMSELSYIPLSQVHQRFGPLAMVEMDFFWKKKSLSAALYDRNPNFFPEPVPLPSEKSTAAAPAKTPVPDAKQVCILMAPAGNDTFKPITVEVAFDDKKNKVWNVATVANYTLATLFDTDKDTVKMDKVKQLANRLSELYPERTFRIQEIGGERRVLLEVRGEKKKKPAAKSASSKSSKSASSKSAKSVKEKVVKETPEDTAKRVAHLSEELRFMRRFVNYEGRIITKSALLNYTKGLQKAITERKIRKNTENGKLISDIQDNVVGMLKKLEEAGLEAVKMDFDGAWGKSLKEVAHAEVVYNSIPLIKRFISMMGEKPSLEKVERLKKAIVLAMDRKKVTGKDIYYSELKEILETLEEYVSGKRSNLKIKPATLSGLSDVVDVSSVGKQMP